jgi:hypothetical protein
MTPPTARDVLVGVAPYGQLGRNFPASGGLPLNDACAGTRFCGTAEQRDELAAFHSITSSAVICMIIGTVTPSAFAAPKPGW